MAGGGFGWAAPDEEVYSFVNDLGATGQPATVGGSAPLPSGIRLELALPESRRLAGGTAYA